ncbi:SANT/Myb_domain [Hexamita inflata]|uniref:SANT/Myb domain n=1 Tax=Hexamita inflata TaxID=28002 RepID=A0AA86UAG8_9EUKA|nr:SANT/Myb domain [Hexamita inflata]
MHTNQRWTEAENHEFRRLFNRYPRDFILIAERMGKSYNQVRSHYYNIQKRERDIKSNQNITELKKSLDTDKLGQLPIATEPEHELIVFDLIY